MSTNSHNSENGMVRLEDIAAKVGVSRSEVSRVINGRVRAGKGVGEAMRRRILEAAREMNYRPHRAAQSLARGRTDTVALMMVIDKQEEGSFPASVMHHELSPHYHEIIGALTYTLRQYGMNLLLVQCGGEDQPPQDVMEEIARSRTCDGMVITDMRVDDKRPQILESAGLPYVVRGSSPKDGVVAVGIDNFQVGYQAITHLHGLGHRRVLFFNIGQDLMSGQGRFRGMCAARDALGLIVECRDDGHYQQGTYKAVKKRLSLPDFPTAIFAEDELGAMGAIRALEEAGKRIPQDVSVMTCLNARFMRQIVPHLTVLDLHQALVAAEAGHLLAKMLRGDAVAPGQRFFAPQLDERGSTAPPPAC